MGPPTRRGPPWEQAVIGKAVDLLSGPGGLAGSCAAASSAPGWAGRACRWTSGIGSIPASIRNAVILRDRIAGGPGGAISPPSACEVHHVRHKKNGGKTSTKDCVCCVSITTRW